MRRSRVLDKVRQGIPAYGVSLHLASADVYEMISLMGFDIIWMDLEHHACSLERAADLMRAARVGNCDIIARPAKGEFMRMGRMLELGATGIMYPRCESAAEAAEVVKWAKFPPAGERGCDASGADVPYIMTPLVEYLQQANERTFIVIQIEDQQALAQIDEIAAVPGVDFLMLGPGDFSILSGYPGQFQHPEVLGAYEKVASAAKKAGINWAATCSSVDHAKLLIEKGARLVFHGNDLVTVKIGMDKIKQEFDQKLKEYLPETQPGNGVAKHYQELV